MNKSTKNVLIATLPTVLTYAVGKVLRAISKRYHLCPQCATGFKQEVRRMEASASSCEGVELVSSNYRGRKKYTGTPRYIETEYHRDREDSINELKTIARYYGCDMVIDVKCQRDVDDEETDSGGTYTYSVWSYSGKAVHKAD